MQGNFLPAWLPKYTTAGTKHKKRLHLRKNFRRYKRSTCGDAVEGTYLDLPFSSVHPSKKDFSYHSAKKAPRPVDEELDPPKILFAQPDEIRQEDEEQHIHRRMHFASLAFHYLHHWINDETRRNTCCNTVSQWHQQDRQE